MSQPNSLKQQLETCRRLGIRYLSMPKENPSSGGVGQSDRTPLDQEGLKNHPAVKAIPKPELNAPSSPTRRSLKMLSRDSWMTLNQDSVEGMELTAYEADIHDCQNCALGATRTRFVFGSGNPKAEVMFVGEAPGADEDAQGLPFVGRAGQLLTKIIESTKTWKREEVFICNVLKCRPPGNRTPLPEEVEHCRPYLEEQVRIIKPKLIMALGASAAQALLSTKEPVGKLRNRWHDYSGIPLRVTYHPAALLRFEGYKKDVWADMKEFSTKYGLIK